ncbi:hypothetical protein HDV57DRAFT_511344 [Trichoderma longibrachiatum]
MSTTNDTEPRSPKSVQVACGFGPSGQAVTQTPRRYDTLSRSSVLVMPVPCLPRDGLGTDQPVLYLLWSPLRVTCPESTSHASIAGAHSVSRVRASQRANRFLASGVARMQSTAGYSSAQPASASFSGHTESGMPTEGWAGKFTCKSSHASLPICFDSSCQCVCVDPWCAHVRVLCSSSLNRTLFRYDTGHIPAAVLVRTSTVRLE